MHAIVTGHSRGIGAAVAEALLSRDIPVLGLSRHGNPGLAARFPGRLQEARLDLSKPAEVIGWLEAGTLSAYVAGASETLLINNAGMLAPTGLLGALEPEIILQALHLNTAAPLLLANAVAALASTEKPVRIAHVSSGAARTPYAGWSVYGATKALLDHHARCVQAENRPWMRICSIAPGVVDTAMQSEIRSLSADAFPSRDRFIQLKSSGLLWAEADCAARLVSYVLHDGFGRTATHDLRV